MNRAPREKDAESFWVRCVRRVGDTSSWRPPDERVDDRAERSRAAASRAERWVSTHEPTALAGTLAAAIRWAAFLSASLLPRPANAIASPLQSVLSPAGIQATRIVQLWNLTLIVCSLVFAAMLLVLVVTIVRNRRADHRTTPDLSSLAQPERRARHVVVAATLLAGALLFGLVFADVLTDHALSPLPVANALTIEVTGHRSPRFSNSVRRACP
jgi:hypothetical protein